MEYMVLGADGHEYGPVGVEALKQWVAEGRVDPQTSLRDFGTGASLTASSVPGLFGPPPVVAAAPSSGASYADPPSHYPPAGSRPANSALIGVLLRSAAAVVMFFVFRGVGLIFASYAMYHAIKAKSEGDPNGTVAILVASFAVAVVGIGWLLRLTTHTI